MPTPWFDEYSWLGNGLLVAFQERYVIDFKGIDALIGAVLEKDNERKKKCRKSFKKKGRSLYDALKISEELEKDVFAYIRAAEPGKNVEPFAKFSRLAEQARREPAAAAAASSSSRPAASTRSSDPSLPYIRRRPIGASPYYDPSRREPAAAASSSSRPAANVRSAAPMISSMMEDIAATQDDNYMTCPRTLSMDDFKSRLLGIVRYADSLFLPAVPRSKLQQWCGQEIGKIDGFPYTRQMANGDLKHLIVEGILKAATWKLEGNLKLSTEVRYILAEGKRPTYTPDGRHHIRPDIVIHEAEDPTEVHAVFDLKFPCVGAAPAQSTAMQIQNYEKHLKPTQGVLMVCPAGFYSGPNARSDAPTPMKEDTYLESAAASAAEDSVRKLTGQPPFSLKPVAVAVREYINYLSGKFSEQGLGNRTNNPLENWPNRSTSAVRPQARSHGVTPAAVSVQAAAASSSCSSSSSSTLSQRPDGSGSAAGSHKRKHASSNSEVDEAEADAKPSQKQKLEKE